MPYVHHTDAPCRKRRLHDAYAENQATGAQFGVWNTPVQMTTQAVLSPLGTVSMIAMIAVSTMNTLKANAMMAAWRTARLS
jgi:hypothetical protein